MVPQSGVPKGSDHCHRSRVGGRQLCNCLCRGLSGLTASCSSFQRFEEPWVILHRAVQTTETLKIEIVSNFANTKPEVVMITRHEEHGMKLPEALRGCFSWRWVHASPCTVIWSSDMIQAIMLLPFLHPAKTYRGSNAPCDSPHYLN